MTSATDSPNNLPRLRTRITAPQRWRALDFRSLWPYRELLYFLLWRDLKVRYKQTALGAAWAVLQPLFTVALFAIVFGGFAHLPADGPSYFVFSYCALLPWSLFAAAVNRSGGSLVGSANLVSKVYFPRIVLPLSAAASSLVDFAIAFALLIPLLPILHCPIHASLILVPFIAAAVLVLGVAVGLGLSALNVRFRDVSYLLTFLLQLWMYASPVAYSASIVPHRWRWLYALNPMVAPIQATRWAVLGTAGAVGVPWVPSLIITALLLVVGCCYFQSAERSFADTI